MTRELSRRGLLIGAGAVAAATAAPLNALAFPAAPPDEDGYDLWLRYRLVEDRHLLASYRRAITHVVAQQSGLVATAAAELADGLTAMLGTRIPVRSRPHGDGAVIVGTPETVAGLAGPAPATSLHPEGYLLRRHNGFTLVIGGGEAGALYGAFHLLRLVQTRREVRDFEANERPANPLRLLNHWDNLDRTVERGYAGLSVFDWARLPQLLERYTDYARTMASVGINGTVINNVNANAQFLSGTMIRNLVPLAGVLREWGVKLYLSANFASPMVLDGITTADPLDPGVRAWWQAKADEVYAAIPDFGGFLVKANSEGQPGPIDYGRTHADGANLIADAVRPHGGIVMWRAFIHDFDPMTWAHKSYQTFTPLDGAFAPNAIVQIKNGPIDFQVREPVHPLFGALPRTNSMMELQITQEYTGQTTHLCYLVPEWKQIYGFDTKAFGTGPKVSDVVDGTAYDYSHSGVAGVMNFGDDRDWTRHQLAAANTHGYARLAWNPDLAAADVATEWVRMTYGPDPRVVREVSTMLLSSWRTYEKYTSPLGCGFMITNPDHLYPDPAGNAPWHQPTQTHVGFDRTAATGINFTGLYHPPVAAMYESLETCPDELLLFIHRVPYTYRLHSGKTVIQHIYDSHFEGLDEAGRLRSDWRSLRGRIDDERYADTLERLDLQFAHATLWRDTLVAYFFEWCRLLDERRSWLQVRFSGPQPAFLTGTTTPNRVQLAVGNATSRAATATVGLTVPEGWSSGTGTVGVPSRELGTLELDVTTPEVSVGFGSLTARASAGSTTVLTGMDATRSVIVTPDGSRCALALDAGTASSPLLATYTRLTPADKWDAARGYGWVGTGPQSRDRGAALDALRRDFVNDTSARTLRIAVPPGQHQAHVLVGDTFDQQPMTIKSGGAALAQIGALRGGTFEWLHFGVDGGTAGREVDLEFAGIPAQHWHLNALVLLAA